MAKRDTGKKEKRKKILSRTHIPQINKKLSCMMIILGRA
jgi:hypothetical protein